ncbi:hypothetical protein VKT23_012660 [Stygiomarasmius scandens]|uniref:Uncharacterized protein n=1 Tax=Marasmiellus scandens TaxID=2682957 RepID=A0ABR1J687_9AGAR
MSTQPQLLNLWSDVAVERIEAIRKLIAASANRINNLEDASEEDRVEFARHNPFMVHWRFTFDKQRKQGAPDWAMATFVKACEAAYQVFPTEAIRVRYGITWAIPEKDIPRLMQRDYGFWSIDTIYGLDRSTDSQQRIPTFQEPGSTLHPKPYLPYKGYNEEPAEEDEEPITVKHELILAAPPSSSQNKRQTSKSKSSVLPASESSTPSTFLPPKPVVEVSPPQKARSGSQPKRKQAGGDDKIPAKARKVQSSTSAPSTVRASVPRPILKKSTPQEKKAAGPDVSVRRVTRSRASSVASTVAPTDDELPDLSDPSIPPESDAASSVASGPTRKSTRRKTPVRTSRKPVEKVDRKGKRKAVDVETDAEQTEGEPEGNDSQYTLEFSGKDNISQLFAKFQPAEQFPLETYGYKSESAYGKKKKAIITFTPEASKFAIRVPLGSRVPTSVNLANFLKANLSSSFAFDKCVHCSEQFDHTCNPQGPISTGGKLTMRKCNCCQRVGQSCTATYPISKLMLTKDLLSTFSLNSTHQLSQRLAHVLELQSLRSRLREQTNALIATIRTLDDQISFGQGQLRESSVDPTVLVSQLAQGEDGPLELDEHTLRLLSVAAGWESNNLDVPSRLQLNEETGEYECVPIPSGQPLREPSPFANELMDIDEEPVAGPSHLRAATQGFVLTPGLLSTTSSSPGPKTRTSRKAVSTSPTVSRSARDKGKEVARSLSASTTPRRPSVSFKDPSSSEPDF